jgi:hypothetical protein
LTTRGGGVQTIVDRAVLMVVEEGNMLTNKQKTKILVDGGDPKETLRIKSLIGFGDGQTTNPSLIARNPEIQRLVASGHTFSTIAKQSNDRLFLVGMAFVAYCARLSILVAFRKFF